MMTERWRAEAEQTMREIDKVRNLDEYDGSVKREVLDIILRLIERVQPQWQPIETAPRDGSWLLAYNADEGKDGYSVFRVFSRGLDPDDWQPTHWMPLPAPPVAGAASPSGERTKQQCPYCKEWCAHGFCGRCERVLGGA